MNKFFLLLPLIGMFILSGCTEEGSSSTDSKQINDGTVMLGGSPSLPTEINLSEKHLITSNSFTNYFEYTAIANEKLVIHASLKDSISSSDIRSCYSIATNTFIKIYDENWVLLKSQSCRYDLTYEFLKDGTYILQFDYPNENSGFAELSSINGISYQPNLNSGRPNSPSRLNLNPSNILSDNSFYNYFEYTAVTNEKIIIHTTLNNSIGSKSIRTCLSGGANGGEFIKIYDQNLVLLKSDTACGNDLTHIFSESGTYILQFNYPNENSGFAEVASIK